ncbi:hypothetical protein ONE63_001002 [Megalurothrips usitatus]|uniref:Uncharacterized protein n=1 Tax=Megalurothrips usitatus TaxID=439358 RepID=A0AAV7XF56_9NEOP|nr:hypothetical protein ONE63_001002 [Megalurothrips usitatus]
MFENNFKSKLQLLKNGGSVKVKPHRLAKNISISLANTCAVDALVHAYSTAYCDSPTFRLFMDMCDSPLLKLAIHITKHGVQALAYKMRADMLRAAFADEGTDIGMGILRIDCAQTPSDLARKLGIPNSLTDVTRCSSEYCPSIEEVRQVTVLTASPDVILRGGVKCLQAAVEGNSAQNFSNCQRPFLDSGHLESVPKTDHFVDNFPPSPATSLQDKVLGGDDPASVEVPVSCHLQDLPLHLNLQGNSFNLRGVVAFDPPILR